MDNKSNKKKKYFFNWIIKFSLKRSLYRGMKFIKKSKCVSTEKKKK